MMSEDDETGRIAICGDGPEARRRAAAIVAAGGVLGFRTDTFYGLGANPFDAGAVGLINDLKGREGKPVLVLVSDAAMTGRLVASRSPLFETLSRKFWPGPLTLVAAANPLLPDELTAGTGTIGVRLPGDDAVRDFVRACGGALTATSANRAARPPARTAEGVAAEFTAGLALVVDGGEVRLTKPSTVVDVSGRRARLIREGLIAWAEIERAVE
jgi:L-threonylcarbamoyladenylate synthase